LVAAAAALSLGVLASAASAATVFATTTTLARGNNFSFTNSGTGGTLSGSGTTAFSFENLSTQLDNLQFLPASFSLSGVVTNDAATFQGSPTNLWTQTGVTGSFSYTYTGGDTTIDGISLTTGELLLKGTFTDAWIQGNGGTGSTNLSLGNGGVLTYTSGVAGVTPPAGSTAEFAYTLLNVTPNFGATSGDALNSFTAKGDGEFDFTGGGVPEPATWALMIMGFGGAGVLLRRRRQAATFA
jgi:hypothetical protein